MLSNTMFAKRLQARSCLLLVGNRRSFSMFDKLKNSVTGATKNLGSKREELRESFYSKLEGEPGTRQAKHQAHRRPGLHFPIVEYDAEGKFLVLHHFGALPYYRVNAAILFLFLGATLYSYVNAP